MADTITHAADRWGEALCGRYRGAIDGRRMVRYASEIHNPHGSRPCEHCLTAMRGYRARPSFAAADAYA